MGCKAVIFDVGGVLLDYERDSMLYTIASACRADTAPEFVSSLIAELDLSAGENTIKDFHSELQRRFACSASLEQLSQVWVEGLRPREWVAGMLQSLKEKTDLYILSDTNAEHWRYITEHILDPHMFNQIFLSHELRMTKKSPEVFNHVLAEIPHAAQMCLFIDDTSANIARMGNIIYIYI